MTDQLVKTLEVAGHVVTIYRYSTSSPSLAFVAKIDEATAFVTHNFMGSSVEEVEHKAREHCLDLADPKRQKARTRAVSALLRKARRRRRTGAAGEAGR